MRWGNCRSRKLDHYNNNNSLYELLGRSQVENVWPFDHPLPLPRWHSKIQEKFKVDNVMTYEILASEIEMFLQKLLEEFNYNTVGNLLKFYKLFKKNGCENLSQFFLSYSPPIDPAHHTCVGSALELWNRLHSLDQRFSNLSEHLFIVSCEENIECLEEYLSLNERLESAAYALEKEHVLLCLKFEIGDRQGVLLCDPGYHVGRVVTVMLDKAYPHTGWFIQSEEGQVRKEYNYQFSPLNSNFVEWNERTARNNIQKTFTGLIHVARAYLTAVDVTERRNLVYNFRSLLSRNQKGDLTAGIYFRIKEHHDEFTMFYQDMGKQRVKLNFSTFKNTEQVDDKLKKMVNTCNEQLNLPENALLTMFQDLNKMSEDELFLQQMLEINNAIGLISEDN